MSVHSPPPPQTPCPAQQPATFPPPLISFTNTHLTSPDPSMIISRTPTLLLLPSSINPIHESARHHQPLLKKLRNRTIHVLPPSPSPSPPIRRHCLPTHLPPELLLYLADTLYRDNSLSEIDRHLAVIDLAFVCTRW